MSTPCAACKYLRKKCTQDCQFAPYFPADNYKKYEAVHKVFGASHITRLLNEIDPSQREEAMNSLYLEAEARLLDPVHGCSRVLYSLNRKLEDLRTRLAIDKNELASYNIIPYDQQNHPMMRPTMASYGDRLTTQQLQQLHEEAQQSEQEAQRFAFTQTGQRKQTHETHNATQNREQ